MNKIKTLVSDVLSLQLFELLVLTSPLYLSCLWSGLVCLITDYNFLPVLGIYWTSALLTLTPIILYIKKSDGENWNLNGCGFLGTLLLFAFFPMSVFFIGFNLVADYFKKTNP